MGVSPLGFSPGVFKSSFALLVNCSIVSLLYCCIVRCVFLFWGLARGYSRVRLLDCSIVTLLYCCIARHYFFSAEYKSNPRYGYPLNTEGLTFNPLSKAKRSVISTSGRNLPRSILPFSQNIASIFNLSSCSVLSIFGLTGFAGNFRLMINDIRLQICSYSQSKRGSSS